MVDSTRYNPQIAWRSKALNVVKLTNATISTPATYRLTVFVIDTNEVGAGQIDIGFFLKDYIGTPYSIIAVDGYIIDVMDDFRTGKCPQSGQNCIVYKSVWKGRSPYLCPENYRHLHPLASGNSHKYDVAILWANDPNTSRRPIAFTDSPKITNYQLNQLDDVNLAYDYGEHPKVRLLQVHDSNRIRERSERPDFVLVDGLIDSIEFGTLDEESEWIIEISK